MNIIVARAGDKKKPTQLALRGTKSFLRREEETFGVLRASSSINTYLRAAGKISMLKSL